MKTTEKVVLSGAAVLAYLIYLGNKKTASTTIAPATGAVPPDYIPTLQQQVAELQHQIEDLTLQSQSNAQTYWL